MSITNGRHLRIKVGGLDVLASTEGSTVNDAGTTIPASDGYAVSDPSAAPAAILLATSCSLSVSGDMLESATKDDNGKWKSKVLSGLTATLTHSGLMSSSNGAIQSHWDSLVAGTEFYWSFTTGVAGNTIFSGRGIFTGMSIDASDLQNSTIEMPIEVSGPVQCVIVS
jgi:hypothetical protein